MPLTGPQKWERQIVVEHYVCVSRWDNDGYSEGYYVREALRFLRAQIADGATVDQAIKILEDEAWRIEEAYESRPGPTALRLNPSQG